MPSLKKAAQDPFSKILKNVIGEKYTQNAVKPAQRYYINRPFIPNLADSMIGIFISECVEIYLQQ
jgi:hypothetical protein